MVMDQYSPYFPQQWPNQWPPAPRGPIVTPDERDAAEDIVLAVEELRELIDSFHKAVDAARTFDRLTGQPHCEDPEKTKLEERVAELERRLDEQERA